MKAWCKASWPITIFGSDRLGVNFSSKDYRVWKGGTRTKAFVAHINAVWEDIEIRNFLIEFVYTHFIEDLDTDQATKKQDLYIRTLSMLSLDMYVDLDIIRKILEKKEFKPYLKGISCGKLLSKIRDVRNWIKIHRDKPDFYKVLAQSWSTYNSGTDVRIKVSKNNDTKKENIVLTPQTDAKQLADLLTKILK